MMGKRHGSPKCKRSSELKFLRATCVSGLAQQGGSHCAPTVCKHTFTHTHTHVQTTHRATHIHNKAFFRRGWNRDINLRRIVSISPHQTFSITQVFCSNWLIRYIVDYPALRNQSQYKPLLIAAVTVSITHKSGRSRLTKAAQHKPRLVVNGFHSSLTGLRRSAPSLLTATLPKPLSTSCIQTPNREEWCGLNQAMT